MPTKVCPFCDVAALEQERRVIRVGELFVSFVSWPRFREGQCLVVPRRHITQPAELSAGESVAIMAEIGRLSARLNDIFGGHGSGVMQKYQPTQADNDIKVSHLHWHVFPRFAVEPNLFPMPHPNSFDGFERPTLEQIESLALQLA